MTESTPGTAGNLETDRTDVGQPSEKPSQDTTGATAATEADGGHVPDKQIGRWKDDGGAVDFTG